MKIQELKEILKNAYSQEKWVSTLKFLSGTKNLLTILLEPKHEEIKSAKAKEIVREIVRLGTLKTTDGITLPIYDVTLQDGIKIEYNRVGVNDLLKTHILKDAIKGAIVTFHYREEYNKSEWRFSFISKFGSDYFAEAESIETNPKKYTYIFGTPEEHRTALERLYNLEQSRFRLEDFFEAFNVEPVSNNFFKEYKNFYQDFVFEISNNKQSRAVFEKEGISKDELEKDIRNFVKRLLGRLVFLYFLQKKRWLGASNKNYDDGDTDFLFHLFNYNEDSRVHFYNKWLSPLFFNALNTPNRINDGFDLADGNSVWIPFLNGGLFDENQEPEIHRSIQLPPTLFELLFKFFNGYNFTIYENSPEDHTVAVDPEMLGHIFENLLEDNKDKGAFYTPKEIVHYMTQESLIEYLNTHLSHSREAIENLIKNHITEGFTREDLKQVEKRIDAVKICDPAIGSGAFPMGLLQEIFALKAVIHYELGYAVWSPAKIKQDIIQNSIYGVDLEGGAVDIARLRFWLSLVVDEDLPKPLPNLDYKIMQGNSLLESYAGIDLSNLATADEQIIEEQATLNFGDEFATKVTLFDAVSMEKFQELLDKYFSPEEWERKTKEKVDKLTVKKQINSIIEGKIHAQLFKEKEATEDKIKDFERKFNIKKEADLDKLNTKSKEFKNYQLLKTRFNEIEIIEAELIDFQNTDERPYFLWNLYFADVFKNGGFDIVIGNPPYIKEYTNKAAFDEFRKTKYYQGKMDLWYGFACKGIDLIKEGGVECFIAQNNWTTSAGASILREKVLRETEIRSFVDFGNYKVFKSAGIQTMIYTLKKVTKNIRENYDIRYSLLVDERIDEKNLSAFLDFDLKNNFAQKYNFAIDRNNVSDKSFTFNTNDDESLLNKIKNKSNYTFSEKEVAQGIVFPQDFLNKKNLKILGGNYKLNEGIFGLSDEQYENLDLSDFEKTIVKPYYFTDSFKRYQVNKINNHWLIYTDSSFKNPDTIEPYPNIKRHLDRFKDVITSDNKPYGLHRAREERFFKGEKIIVQRKCPNRPVFTYTNFDSYVSATFYIIKTENQNHKYLTALLNSKLIAFWLKNKGNMQGSNYQLDKAPLLNIPVFIPTETKHFQLFVTLLNYICSNSNVQINETVKNEHIANFFEEVIDGCVFELYFEEHMKEKGINIIDDVKGYLEQSGINDSFESLSEDAKKQKIWELYKAMSTGVVQVKMTDFVTKSPDILKPILQS